MAKKTLKGWEKSNLNRDAYLNVGDEIDEDLFLDIAECVAPEYCDQKFVQNGEPSFHRRNTRNKKVYYHETAFSANDGKFYYLGDLPSMNND